MKQGEMNNAPESAQIETEETSIDEVLDQIDDVTNLQSINFEADETSVYEIINEIDEVTFQNSVTDEHNESVVNGEVFDNGDVMQTIDISEVSQLGSISSLSSYAGSECNEDVNFILHSSVTNNNESEPESSNKRQSECIDPFDIGSSPCVHVYEASDEGRGNDSDNCSHYQARNASVNSDDEDRTVIEIGVEIDSETEKLETQIEKLETQIDGFSAEDQVTKGKSTNDNQIENKITAIVNNNDTDKDKTVIDVSEKGKESEIDRNFDDTADDLLKGNNKAENKIPTKYKDVQIRRVCFGGRDSGAMRKKRHLSSKADSEITPKRIKNIQVNSDLSPIENAFTLSKERGIIEAFGETPAVYSKSMDLNESRENPESSTPKTRNISQVRKVILMDDSDVNTEISNISKTIPVCSEKDFLSKLYNTTTLVEVSDQEENNDVRKVICKSEKFKLSGQNKKPIYGSVFTKDVLEPTRYKMTTNSNIISVPCTPGHNQDNQESKMCITISDSTYFSEDTRRSFLTENTSKSEGRFRNVEATISKIEFLDDEDILLTEDILGLESAYDFDESEIDEDTLLAESDDSNTSMGEICKKDSVGSEGNFKNVDTNISKQEIESDENILLSEETLGIENDKKDKEIDDGSFQADDYISSDSKCEGKTVVSKISIASNREQQPCLPLPVDIIVVVASPEKRNIDVKQSEKNPGNITPENKVNVENEIFQNEEGNEQILYENCANDQQDSKKAESEVEATSEKPIEIVIEIKDKIKDNKSSSSKKKGTNILSQKVQSNQESLFVINKNNNNCNMTAKSIVSPIDMTFLANDKNNDAMEEVKRRWGCDNIPSQEVNLTIASKFHQNYSKQNANTRPVLLEGEKISCLDFYEGEMNIKHQVMNHCSLSQVMNKLRQQKADLDQIKLTTLRQLEQESYRKCTFLRNRHREEFNNLHKRQRWQFDELNHNQFMMPFVKQQQIMALGLHHGEEEERLQQHQRFEFENLTCDLKTHFMREAECMKEEMTPVDLLILQMKKMKETQMPSMEKYGPMVMVSLNKRPCKANNWKKSTDDVCLPVVIAQALSHEEDVYNHFYKF